MASTLLSIPSANRTSATPSSFGGRRCGPQCRPDRICLRLPCVSSQAPSSSEPLEDISYLLRIPQRKHYGTMEGDVKKALKVVSNEKESILNSMPVILKKEDWLCMLHWWMGRGYEACLQSKRKKENLEGLKDLVLDLPGQPKVGFQHYAGYVTVNEKHGRELFYWFFEAASGAAGEKPLVLWLNGGPGCSSLGYGATQEIGPFSVNSRGDDLELNPYAWNKEANILFLESPVGVGFSYSNKTTDYDLLGDDFTAKDTYTFLHKWFNKFPEYRNRSFYIAGESYAGKYIPELAELIYDMNKDPSLYIDLKGFLLGNPETSDAEDWQGMMDYAWSHAVISDETYRIIKEHCDFNSSKRWSNQECNNSVAEVMQQYKEIDIYSLYTSVCINSSSNSGAYTTGPVYKKESTMIPRMMGGNYDPCVDDYARSFYNRPEVQRALHASDGVNLKNWSICNTNIFSNWKDSKSSMLPIYKKLIAAGLKSWVYSGDTDGRVPVLSTRYSINALELPKIGSWRPWYHQMQVAGWLQEYEGLTFVTFRGAGHAVPMFKPSTSLALFTSFITGESLPLQRRNS